MGGDGIDLLSAFRSQGPGCIGHRPGRIDHVVDQHAGPTPDLTDHPQGQRLSR